MRRRTLSGLIGIIICACPALAQQAPPASPVAATKEVQVTLYADVAAVQAGKSFRLAAKFTIADEWHIYYRDPGETGLPVRLRFTPVPGLEFGEPQYPVPVKYLEAAGRLAHGYKQEATLIVPVKAAESFAAGGEVKISARASWLVCKTACLPGKTEVTLTLPTAAAGAAVPAVDKSLFDAAAAKIAKPTAPDDPVKVTLAVNRSAVRPGDALGAAVVLDIPAGMRLPRAGVEWIVEVPVGFEKPESDKPVEGVNHRVVFPAGDEYTGRAVLYTTLIAGTELTADAEPVLRGIVQYRLPGQARRDAAVELAIPVAAAGSSVQPIHADIFKGYVPPAGAGGAAAARDPGVGPPDPPPPAAGPVEFDLDKIRIEEDEDFPIAVWMALGVLAGFLLNFMPCVLPVLGIKIMSFVQQAAGDPSRVWKLGVAFSLGLLLVFELLAALSAGAGAAWGEQFGKPWFILAITVVIFVFALSLFGVWTIQLPGSVNDLSGKVQAEGYTASFLKGMLTTVLATPCAGPWLGSVVGWTLRQPAAVIFAVFTCIGLGMAFPYLVLSANPRLMRFMPKPGPWMETFERAMGFVLMGSVVYFLVVLHGQLGGDVLPATISFLLAVAFAVWTAAVLSNPARNVPRPLAGWTLAAAIAAGAHWLTYSYLWPTPRLSVVEVQDPLAVKDPAQLTWIPYSRNRLAQLVLSGKTVHVDFTAVWCPNCILMEKTVLNTVATKKVVDELGVVNMKADWSDGESEIGRDIGELLRALRSPSIPIQAIFPPGDLYRPIVIRDIFTHEQFAAALRRAAGRATAVQR